MSFGKQTDTDARNNNDTGDAAASQALKKEHSKNKKTG
jgi:hypothetical protein